METNYEKIIDLAFHGDKEGATSLYNSLTPQEREEIQKEFLANMSTTWDTLVSIMRDIEEEVTRLSMALIKVSESFPELQDCLKENSDGTVQGS